MSSVFNEEDVGKIRILDQVKQHNLTQKEAAQQLGLSIRQIRRLLVRLKGERLKTVD